MIVVITNKYKEKIAISEIKKLPYKCASGCYPARTFVKNLSKFEIDTLIVDITALQDIYAKDTWSVLTELVDPSKIFILLEANKSYKSASFFAMLIEMGIYNFAKSPGEIADLIENPQTYEDVEDYCKIAADEEAKKLEAQERFAGLEQRVIEQQEDMQQYVYDSQQKGFNKPKKPKYLSLQLLTGAVVLPLLTIICTCLFYLLEMFAAVYIQPGTFVAEGLYSSYFGTELTPLLLLGFVLSYFIFLFYYLILDPKVKHKQVPREKFIVLPFAIFSTLFFLDYYILGIFNSVFTLTINAPNQNIYHDFNSYNLMVVGLAIVVYYFKILIANSKIINFEKDLTHSIKLGEWLFLIVMVAILILPVTNWLIINLLDTTSFLNTMMIQFLVVVQVLLALMIIMRAVTKRQGNEKRGN